MVHLPSLHMYIEVANLAVEAWGEWVGHGLLFCGTIMRHIYFATHLFSIYLWLFSAELQYSRVVGKSPVLLFSRVDFRLVEGTYSVLPVLFGVIRCHVMQFRAIRGYSGLPQCTPQCPPQATLD